MEDIKIQIYGTFGPSCKSEEVLEEMIKAGMTGMRLNLSHTTLEKSKEYIENYRRVAERKKVIPQILIDMQGPELRIGEMQDITLNQGERICLVSDEKVVGSKGSIRNIDEFPIEKAVPIPMAVMQAISPEKEVLLDDGKIRARIMEAAERYAKAEVLVGGILKPHKSIKIVDVNVDMPVLTEHDIHNIRMAKEYGVTALMQPFVFLGEDLRKVREVLKEEQAEHLQIFAKIENKIGVENLDTILPEADLIVIARGDLGNDMPLWELPAIQKKIENICKKYGKPYMVVTQMLASMEQNPIPTRAEVSDIFHAVYHGAEAVMVTGETAVGKYPVEAIRYLSNTAKEAVRYHNGI